MSGGKYKNGTKRMSVAGVPFLQHKPVTIENSDGEDLLEKLETKTLTKEAQNLTDAEKAQVLENIGAAKKENIFTINGAEVSEGDDVIVGEGGVIVIDDEMSENSENAPQNKVVKAYVDDNIFTGSDKILSVSEESLGGYIGTSSAHIFTKDEVAYGSLTEISSLRGKGLTIFRDGMSAIRYAFLKDDYIKEGKSPHFCTGKTLVVVNITDTESVFEDIVPDDCNYIYVFIRNTYGVYSNTQFVVKEGKERESRIDIIEDFVNEKRNVLKLNCLEQSGNIAVTSDVLVFPYLAMKIKARLPIGFTAKFNTSQSADVVCGAAGGADLFVHVMQDGTILQFADEEQVYSCEIHDNTGTQHDIVGMCDSGDISFDILSHTDAPIVERQYDCEVYAKCFEFKNGKSVGTNQYPMIVHTSDSHSDATRLNDVFEYADFLNAVAVVNSGDFVQRGSYNGHEYISEIALRHKTPLVLCAGNHDSLGREDSEAEAYVFSKLIEPFASRYGYKQNASTQATKTYYYRDDVSSKIRFISLNLYEELGGTPTSSGMYSVKARITGTQINWLIDTLASTPQGFGVIIVQHHYNVYPNVPEGAESFNSDAVGEPYGIDHFITNYPIRKIVDAFIGKTSVSGSFTNNVDDSTFEYNADFSNIASGTEFIAYMTGHTHKDNIGYDAGATNMQLEMCVTCTTASVSVIESLSVGANGSDIPRGMRGKVQDAFNVYVVDRANKRIGVARVGSNVNFKLKDRKAMWISYAI